LILMRLWPSI